MSVNKWYLDYAERNIRGASLLTLMPNGLWLLDSSDKLTSQGQLSYKGMIQEEATIELNLLKYPGKNQCQQL